MPRREKLRLALSKSNFDPCILLVEWQTFSSPLSDPASEMVLTKRVIQTLKNDLHVLNALAIVVMNLVEHRVHLRTVRSRSMQTMTETRHLLLNPGFLFLSQHLRKVFIHYSSACSRLLNSTFQLLPCLHQPVLSPPCPGRGKAL